jgi:hypothetical protein
MLPGVNHPLLVTERGERPDQGAALTKFGLAPSTCVIALPIAFPSALPADVTPAPRVADRTARCTTRHQRDRVFGLLRSADHAGDVWCAVLKLIFLAALPTGNHDGRVSAAMPGAGRLRARHRE